MPKRLRVAAGELRAATPAFDRFERLHVVALVGRDQRSFVFLMAGLPATFLPGLPSPRLRPGVRMLRAGRQRGVLRCFLPAFKLRDPVEQRLYENAHRRSHLGFKFQRNRQWLVLSGRHDRCRPRKSLSRPDQFTEKHTPGSEPSQLLGDKGTT
jgi:hypothetical protein